MTSILNQLQTLIDNNLRALEGKTLGRKYQLDCFWSELNRLQGLSQIEIGRIDFCPDTDPLNESIEIISRADVSLNIGNWRVQAGSPDQTYTIPEDTVLMPHSSIKINTAGRGQYSFQSATPIWNNRGDSGTLYDENDQLVSSIVYGEKAHPNIMISEINYDGMEFRHEGDEYVELTNLCSHRLDISNWVLISQRNNAEFTFPQGSYVEPQGSIRVYTNKGNLQLDEFSFNSRVAIWNNDGGCCTLLDYSHREVSRYMY